MSESRLMGDGPSARRRPKKYRLAAAERVLSLVRQSYALDVIAARAGMPTLDTLQRWLDENTEFRNRYESTRQFQGDVLADQVVAMADLITLALASATLRARVTKLEARFR